MRTKSELRGDLAEYFGDAPVFVRRVDGLILHWARGAEDLYGYTANEAVGRRSHDLLATRFPEPLTTIEAQLLTDRRWQGRLRQRRRDGGRLWTESLWRLRNNGGAGQPLSQAVLVVEMNTDVTATVAAERQRDLLARELSHRVKNTLAVVQGLAHFTLASIDPEVRVRFEERLKSLSTAHDLLLARDWLGAGLEQVAWAALATFDVAQRVTVAGPDVELTPTAAIAYAMALHELATNAVKYGALSAPGGRVTVEWTVYERDEVERIHLFWRESGGPPVTAPKSDGFGFRLVRRALATELGTPVEIRFEPEGLVCEFDGPLQKRPVTLEGEDSA
jgi:two-component system CheB/CheR fusion protein